MQLTFGTWRVSLDRLSVSQPELARLYDATAWYWDALLRLGGFGHAYRLLFDALQQDGWVDQSGEGLQVLDGGIGTGLFSDAFLSAVHRPVEIYGVDLSPKMLAKARERFTMRGVRGTLECRDARSLPLPDGQRDVILSAFMLEHANDPLAVLREMARVARPRATLVLVLACPQAPDWWFRLRYRYQPFPPAQITNWMTAAGWQNIRPYALTGLARFFGRAYVARKQS